MRAALALIAALAGCADCEVEPPVVAACVSRVDDQETLDVDPLLLDLVGTVTLSGRGVDPQGCMSSAQPFGADPGTFNEPDVRWLRMEDAEGGLWFASVWVQNEAFVWPVQGDAISLRYGENNRDAVVPSVTLELRGATGNLVLLAAQAESVEGLGLASEVGVELGGSPCALRDDCGRAAQHDLQVRLQARDELVSPGEVHEMGVYRFVHGGAEVDRFGDQAACGEGGSRVRLAVLL